VLNRITVPVHVELDVALTMLRLIQRSPTLADFQVRCFQRQKFVASSIPRAKVYFSLGSSRRSTSSSKAPAAVLGSFIVCLVGTASAVVYQRRRIRSDADTVAALPLYEGNPVVFLDIVDHDVPVGRLVFQLRSDCVPRAAENFRQLCVGTPGWGYRTSALHGIEKQNRVFGGDFFGAGSGGHSIYGEVFDDETLTALRHVGPGMLAMRNYGPNTNNSQFYVTLRAMPQLDGVHEVIGSLLEGFEVLEHLDKCALPAKPMFHPSHDFRVGACGELHDYAGRPRVPRPPLP
jgi:cyclophilin family peptidyl-prolyl cis-trans isomerase